MKCFCTMRKILKVLQMCKSVHLKKPTAQPTKSTAGTAFFNSFVQNDGFYKVGEVLFLFICFFGERQKIVPFTKLTTIQKVNWTTVLLKIINRILFSN